MKLSLSRLWPCSVLFSVLLVASCVPATNDSYLRRTAYAANDHIMLVQKDPPTFGFQRLHAHATAYPDLAVFLRQQGDPGFLAETEKSGNRYLILYYLERRKAFACRTGGNRSRLIEFSGPYPITDGEAKALRTLRKAGGEG